MPRGVRYGNSCGAVAHKTSDTLRANRAMIDIPAQIPNGYIHDGLLFTKHDMPVPGLPVWQLVVWGLTKFHNGSHEPLNTVMVNIFVTGSLTTLCRFYQDTLTVLLAWAILTWDWT